MQEQMRRPMGHVPFTENSGPAENGAAGPQGEPGPNAEPQPVTPEQNGFEIGTPEPARPGDVI
jgi:hypothetical protein